MKWLRKLKARVVYRNAIELAEKRHAETGKRFYVVPDERNRLIVMDRKNFRLLKKKGYLPNTSTLMLKEHCLYYTANGANEAMGAEESKQRKMVYIHSC